MPARATTETSFYQQKETQRQKQLPIFYNQFMSIQQKSFIEPPMSNYKNKASSLREKINSSQTYELIRNAHRKKRVDASIAPEK